MPDYPHTELAHRIEVASQPRPGDPWHIGMTDRHVEVDPATLTRIVDRLDAALANLRTFGDHRPTCAAVDDPDPATDLVNRSDACDCGWSVLAAQLAATDPARHPHP